MASPRRGYGRALVWSLTFVVSSALAGACSGRFRNADEDDAAGEGGLDGATGGSSGSAGRGSGGKAGAGGSSGNAGEGGDPGTSGSGGAAAGAGSGGKGGSGSGTPGCGDGTVASDETCDDGNRATGDGCSSTCQREEGWRCDQLEPTRCREDCGDGLLVGAERVGTGCDDGNGTDGDGCDQYCEVEPGSSCTGEPSTCESGCGDGELTATEECDDENPMSGDGCSEVCRVEPGWSCPDAGMPCVSTAECGDGELGGPEQCDDGNQVNGDGCAKDCLSVDDGWLCPAPNTACRPRCGDGELLGDEECDDENAMTGDGCSSTCFIEPGWSCNGSACTLVVCGNGTMEPGESCDRGADNGLLYGDGSGCTRRCTHEPICRTGGVTGPCSTACGDGNIDSGEACDDGNQVDGDGCSASCDEESGFVCDDDAQSDSEPCSSAPGLDCVILPMIYRDFDGQEVSGGHPDFFYFGAAATGGRTTGVVSGKTACVPDASGTKVPFTAGGYCPTADTTGPCPGIAAATLNAQGKPALSRDTCPCAFTDWDQTGLLTGVTGVQTCTVEGAGTIRERIDTTVKVVESPDTFAQWYLPSASSTEIRGKLELAATGQSTFRFSSGAANAPAGAAGHTVLNDIHDACLGAGHGLTSGFFPLDTLTSAGSSKLCNIWPYWLYGSATSATCRAGYGYPVLAQWDPLAAWDACPSTGTGGAVPRSDGMGTPLQGVLRNFHFTSEAHYLFRYTAPVAVSFNGDDDAWVFVNGKLAIDLGATHGRMVGSATIDTSFGLVAGRTYEIAVFHADRHPRDSDYELTLPASSFVTSLCQPTCGDGVVTTTEECDAGDENDDSGYGGCTTDCHFAAFCGDGLRNGPEECDVGAGNGVTDCDAACRVRG